MKESFVSFATSLPCLFPSVEECIRFEYDTSNFHENNENQEAWKGIYVVFGNSYALIEGNVLTLFQVSYSEEEWVAETITSMEFENALSSINWDLSGNCLALSDAKGVIHLVSKSGLLLFSKSLFSGL